MSYLTDLGLGHLTLTTEQFGYQRLGGIQVAGGEERRMLLGIGSGTMLHLIKCQKTIGDGLCGHGEDGQLDAVLLVWHAQGIELTRDLLVHQLLSKGLDAGYFSLGIGFGLHGVEVQFAMNTHLDSERFHGQRCLFARCFVVGLEGSTQLAIQSAQIALHEGRREIRHQRGIGATLGNHGLAHITDSIEVEMRQGAHKAVAPAVLRQRHLFAGGIF